MSRSAMWVFSKASNWYRIINTALSRPPSMAFGLSPRSTLGRAVDGFGRVFERAHPVALGAAVGVTAFFTRDYADVRRMCNSRPFISLPLSLSVNLSISTYQLHSTFLILVFTQGVTKRKRCFSCGSPLSMNSLAGPFQMFSRTPTHEDVLRPPPLSSSPT
eukprot:TRINITY_DN2348_c0_g1_i2.p1 TRINITY_DN2348_c0_g1~~TRINITY_DN2348_c0_g1_i2.p1  ORF type:complete len:161 (-),score=13.65 TRINITY_DN2348_c0_g1_i2:379-861(-)